MRRNVQAIHHLLARHDAPHQFLAQRGDLAGRRLYVGLDLPQREDVAGALVPIGRAVDVSIGEADLLEVPLDVRSRRGRFAFHQPPLK